MKNTTNPATPKDLGDRVVAGTVWLVAMRWGIRALGLGSTLIIARLLTPEDFGVVAIATSYIGIISGVTELNLSRAIIQFRDPGPEEYNTAWTMGVLRGLILALLIAVSALPVASLMNEPRLKAVIVMLALAAAVRSLENPYFVEFQKELNFSKLFWAETSSKILAVVTTISLALAYRNYWALVGGMIVASVASVFFSYYFRPALPKLCLSALRRFVGFAVWLSGEAFLTEINNRFSNFVIGASLGAGVAGKFHMSIELSGLVNEVIGPLSRATYSAYSKLNDDIQRLSSMYVNASSIIFSIVLPAGVGLALISHDFVYLVLGEQWIDIAPYLTILGVMIGVVSFVTTADSILIALGHQRLVFYREALLSLVTIITIGIALWHEALMGFVVARCASGIVWAILTQYFVQRYLGHAVGFRTWQRVWRPLLSVLVMIFAVSLVGSAYPETQAYGDTILRLGLFILVGAVSYVAVLLLLWQITGKPDGPEKWIIKNLENYFVKN